LSEWSNFLNDIKEYFFSLKNTGTTVFFRGQADSSWPLLSTLHRHILESTKTLNLDPEVYSPIDLLNNTYKSIFYKFKSKSWHLLKTDEKTDWGIIFSMRHNGIPTTLIDWTESFSCALYFANFKRDPTSEAAIFILDAEALNHKVVDKRGIISLYDDIKEPMLFDPSIFHPKYTIKKKEERTVAVAPVLTNARMIAQQSGFTISRDSFTPLEAMYPDEIKKFILPFSTYEESVNYLDFAGIKHFSFFPDLYGIVTDIKSHLEWEIKMARSLISKMQP